MAKSLKSGKIAVKLSPDTIQILRKAVRIRIELDQQPNYLEFLLEEAYAKLEGEKCSFRKSEYFALFHQDTMRYIDIPTQMIIREAVQLEPTVIPAKWTVLIDQDWAVTSEPAFIPVTHDENIGI